MSVISSLSKRGQYSTVSRMSEVPVTEGLILYLDSSDEASYDGGPTTNYFKPSEGTFQYNGQGTFQRIRSGSYGGYIIRPTDVVYRFDLTPVNGCYYHGNPIPTGSVGIGNSILFTFDYFISPGTVLLNDYLANIEKYNSASQWTNGVGISNSGRTIGVWQSVSLSTTINSVDYYVNAYLYPGGCSPSYMAVDGFILYKNSIVKYYDATQIGSRVSSSAASAWSKPTTSQGGGIVIGTATSTVNTANAIHNLKGYIGEVRIYDHALTADEVSTLYKLGIQKHI